MPFLKFRGRLSKESNNKKQRGANISTAVEARHAAAENLQHQQRRRRSRFSACISPSDSFTGPLDYEAKGCPYSALPEQNCSSSAFTEQGRTSSSFPERGCSSSAFSGQGCSSSAFQEQGRFSSSFPERGCSSSTFPDGQGCSSSALPDGQGCSSSPFPDGQGCSAPDARRRRAERAEEFELEVRSVCREPGDRDCVRRVERLGCALLNIFQEVKRIDDSLHKLKRQFQLEAVAETRYMSCLCALGLARAACCKTQITAWRSLQRALVDFHCHSRLSADPPSEAGSGDDDVQCRAERRESRVAASSLTAARHAANEDPRDCGRLVLLLTKLTTLQKVKRLLDPVSDARTFVSHWVLQ